MGFSPPLDGAPWPWGKAPHSWASTSSPFLRAGLFFLPLSGQCQGQPPTPRFMPTSGGSEPMYYLAEREQISCTLPGSAH